MKLVSKAVMSSIVLASAITLSSHASALTPVHPDTIIDTTKPVKIKLPKFQLDKKVMARDQESSKTPTHLKTPKFSKTYIDRLEKILAEMDRSVSEVFKESEEYPFPDASCEINGNSVKISYIPCKDKFPEEVCEEYKACSETPETSECLSLDKRLNFVPTNEAASCEIEVPTVAE